MLSASANAGVVQAYLDKEAALGLTVGTMAPEVVPKGI